MSPNKVKQRGESNPLPLHPTGNHIVVLLKQHSAASWYFVSNIKMIGVQSCKHFGCQRSQMWHPSGAAGTWS